VGDENITKGGSLIYMPYTHKILTRGGGHASHTYLRRTTPSVVRPTDAVMDLMANRDTTVIMSDKTQLLITPATENNNTLTHPLTLAVIQHATFVTPTSASVPIRTRTALIPIPPTAALHRTKRDRSQTNFYKPHDIRTVTEALHTIMDRKKNQPHSHRRQ
jgi:hypothetical protein